MNNIGICMAKLVADTIVQHMHMRDAVQKGNYKLVKKLILDGVDVNYVRQVGKSFQLQGPRCALDYAIASLNIPIIQLLLQAGATRAQPYPEISNLNPSHADAIVQIQETEQTARALLPMLWAYTAPHRNHKSAASLLHKECFKEIKAMLVGN